MITTNKNNLVKEGYLDIKVPYGNRERKLWKAWQKRWLVSKTVTEPCGLELQIYGCQKTSNSQPLWTVFISPESGRLYRSRSRTHAWAFSVASATVIILHLAGESEELSQSWMAAIRDAVWPPSPLVQLEAAFQDVHRVSLIDDDNTCCSDLFAAYGHLYMAGDVILLMSTHSGRLIKQWHLSEVLNVDMERLDEGKTSGVLSLTFQNESLQHGKQLNFYSQTATSVVQHMSAALKMKQEVKAPKSPTLKYDSGIEELSEIFSLGNERRDGVNSFNPDGWSSRGRLSEGLRNLATMSGDFLNCSVNSAFIPQDFSGGSRTSSEASSDYSPPVSPMDPTSPNQDRIINPEEMKPTSKDSLDHYYCDTNAQNFQDSLDLDYALIMQHRSSTSSGIYADISSPPPSKRPSLAETLYEDIDEEDEGFIKLMDEIMDDEYLPPLPPPRNINNADTYSKLPVERFTKTAKRPSTLGLENLSSSISETLSQIQVESGPNCKTAKKNFPVGLFKPIKEVKKILGSKKNFKSPLSSPTNENSNKDSLSNQNHSLQERGTPNIGHHSSESLLITDDTESSEAERDGNSYNESTCSSVKNSAAHSPDENFVPFPELSTLPMACNSMPSGQQGGVKQYQNFLSSEAPSVVLRDGQRGKQARSCDSILLESLKSKYSCHRQFLQFLQVDKTKDFNHDTLPHVCQQTCLLRSISLEQLPCKSSHCLRHSFSNHDNFSYNSIEKFKNENLRQAVTDLKMTNLEDSMLQRVLSRRRSSDYCAMNILLTPSSEQESEMYATTYEKEQNNGIKDSVNQEWSNSLPTLNEHESLYMDMTQTTKQVVTIH